MRLGKIPFSNPRKITLTDLISLSELQEMQDSFAEVASVAIRTLDTNGNFLTQVTNAPSLCSMAFESNVIKEKVCRGCRPQFLGGEGIVDDDFSFECFPGLKNYLIPLKVGTSATDSLILGYIVIGPVIFMKRKSREEFDQIAKEASLDPDQLWNLVLELRVFSHKGIRSFLDMVDNLTSRILTLAYGKLTMQKKVMNHFADHFARKAMLEDATLSEFLELFLDLVMDVTRGDTGSVMLLDRRKKELTIKAGHGLPEDVVKRTVQKLGEGISGLAAETKKSFLINEDSVDEFIRSRLKKPDLFSSVVVPIKCRDQICGVVNVSSDRTSLVKFDETTLAFLTKAAGLAGLALQEIQSN